jgi:hypothetical protein
LQTGAIQGYDAPEKESLPMNVERDLVPPLLVAALLVAVPMLVWSAFDLWRPEAATLGDRALPAFETYEVELYKSLSDRDAYLLTDYDEKKVRAMYGSVAAHHVQAVRAQSLRGLVMYGALFVISLGMLAFKFKVSRR